MSDPHSGRARVTLLAALLLLLAGAGVLGVVLTLRPGGPALSRLEPDRARPGDSVILQGSGFDASPAANIVLVGDRTGRVVQASDTQLTVEVPDLELVPGQSSSVPVRVVVGKAATSAASLQVFLEATVLAELPPAAAGPAASGEGEEAAVPAEPAPQPATERAPARAAAPRPRAPRPTPAPAAPLPTLAPEPPAAPPLPPAQRRFVLERTAVESSRRVNADLEGFETDGVDVKRAPDVLGRVDFEVTPGQVKPGDRYTVTVYLSNDGKKDIKLKDMFVATSINGRLVSGPGTLRSREVGPKKKNVIASFSDTWRDTISTWAMDVTVTSDRGDIYKNQIAWK